MSDDVTPAAPAAAPAIPTPADVAPQVEPTTPKPTETVEFWKQKAREQEGRAKSNADAATRLAAIEDAQKTEAQKAADATARAQQEAAEARAEAARYKVAAKHSVTEDYFDLLGTGDEATITARAEKLAPLIAVATENAQLKAELEALRQGKPTPGLTRPVVDLKPGATPSGAPTEGDLIYQSLFGS